MHRFIMNPSQDKIVDHINHIPIDNRRENLRLLMQLQNSQNRRKSLYNTISKYKGVQFDKKNQKI